MRHHIVTHSEFVLTRPIIKTPFRRLDIKTTTTKGNLENRSNFRGRFTSSSILTDSSVSIGASFPRPKSSMRPCLPLFFGCGRALGVHDTLKRCQRYEDHVGGGKNELFSAIFSLSRNIKPITWI